MKHKKNKIKLALIFLISLVIISLNIAAAIYFFYFSPEETSTTPPELSTTENTKEEAGAKAEAFSLSDEYYSIHFNYGDAVEVCLTETRSRNNNLVQFVVNELSSRYNQTKDIYFIKINTYVGTPLLYDEKEHTCHIDPKVQGVTFYKEITRRTALRPIQ